MARSLAMTFLALSLLLIPALAYGDDCSTRMQGALGELGNNPAAIERYEELCPSAFLNLGLLLKQSEIESGAPYSRKTQDCLYRVSGEAAAKMAGDQVLKEFGRDPGDDSDDPTHPDRWAPCFVQ